MGQVKGECHSRQCPWNHNTYRKRGGTGAQRKESHMKSSQAFGKVPGTGAWKGKRKEGTAFPAEGGGLGSTRQGTDSKTLNPVCPCRASTHPQQEEWRRVPGQGPAGSTDSNHKEPELGVWIEVLCAASKKICRKHHSGKEPGLRGCPQGVRRLLSLLQLNLGASTSPKMLTKLQFFWGLQFFLIGKDRWWESPKGPSKCGFIGY